MVHVVLMGFPLFKLKCTRTALQAVVDLWRRLLNRFQSDLRREVSRQIQYILLAQRGRHTLHYRIAASARLVVLQYLNQIIGMLPGQSGIYWNYAVAVGAVTRSAGSGF